MIARESSRASRSTRPRPVGSPVTSLPHHLQHLPHATFDPAAPVSASDVLLMQRTIGNQHVLRHLRHVAAPITTVQRKATGLKQSAQVSAFATDALTYFKNAANKDKPLNEYATHLLNEINGQLKAMGSEECTSSFDASGDDSGTFSRVTWNVAINTNKFSSRAGVSKVGDLTVDEAAEVADTLYHECRHSEQYFRIARMLAGQSAEKDQAKLAAEIAKKMTIPNKVALAAAKVPLADNKANAALISEAKNWESITIGIHEDYKGNINTWDAEIRAAEKLVDDVTAANVVKTKGDLDTQLTAWAGASRGAFVDAHLQTTEAIDKKQRMDKLVVKHLKAIKKRLPKVNAAWKVVTDGWAGDSAAVSRRKIQKLGGPLSKLEAQVYAAYRDHLHEKDAWETGALAGAAFRNLAKKKK
jgi:hypothetical protein